MMPELTPDQREAIESDANTVVTAGAGSGKTLVLARRFLHLIRSGRAEVSEILTLTFTRKAAAEMYARIYGMLREHRSDHLVARALEGFDAARISTLDAFAATLARGRAQDFGLPPDFVQDEDAVRDLIGQEAPRFAIAERERLRPLLEIYSFGRIIDDLLVPLAWEMSLAAGIDFAEVLRNQESVIRAALEDAKTGFGDLAVRFAIWRESVAGSAKILADALDQLPDPQVWTDSPEAVLEWLEPISFRMIGGNVQDPEKIAAREAMGEFRTLQEKTVSALVWMLNRPLFEACADVLSDWQSRVATAKRGAGTVTFRDVADLAVAALREDLEYRRFHKESIRYIMIDEFQDNNHSQKELLYLLAERQGAEVEGIPAPGDLDPHKLFFVGDEKQSIYRFRGADVSVFKGLQRELQGESVELDANFRSEPELVDFFNELFPGVFGAADEDFQARFRPLVPKGPVDGVDRVRLLYGYMPDLPEGALDRTETEAYRTALWVKETLDSGEFTIPTEEGERPLRPDDIAVLMRSTGNQREYERMFRLLDIPYRTQEPRSIFLEAPANDLYAMLQLVPFPDDRLAYAAALRSPFANLSDEGFAHAMAAPNPVFSPVSGISEEDARRLAAAAETYEGLKRLATRGTPLDLVDYLWFDAGYRYHVLSREEYRPYLEFYDYLSAMALSPRGASGLVTFLEFLRENLGKFERLPELEVLRSQGSGVQFMTIHKSKGLEFPVVIVADMGNRGRSGGTTRLYATHGGFSLYLPGERRRVNFFADAAREAESARSDAELRRLLYVAMTRAERYLLLVGTHHEKNPSGTASLLNLLALGLGLAPAELATWDRAEVIPSYDRREIDESARQTPTGGLRNLGGGYEHPIVRRAKRREFPVTALNERYESVRPPKELSPSSGGRWAGLEAPFGTLCHAILERRVRGDYGRIALPSEAVDPFPADRFEEALAEAEELAEGFFQTLTDSPLPAGDSVHWEPEVPFLYALDSSGGRYWLSGVMDLVVRGPDGCVVIDYKSDAQLDSEDYAPQLAVYREAAAALFGGPVACYLYSLHERRYIPAPEPRVPLAELLVLGEQ